MLYVLFLINSVIDCVAFWILFVFCFIRIPRCRLQEILETSRPTGDLFLAMACLCQPKCTIRQRTCYLCHHRSLQ